MSNSQLHKLKSRIKKSTKVALKLSLNIVADYSNGNNFQHKLLLNNTQVSELCKAFENKSSSNIKLTSFD